jgi:transcriptional regulator with XRE-family HTH domain
MTTIGNNIKSLREAAGMTQQDLAHESLVTISTIVKIEAGTTVKPNKATCHLIAAALGVTLNELFKEDANDNHAPN